MYMSMLDFYTKEIQSQYDATMSMIEGGLHIDIQALVNTRIKIQAEIGEHEKELIKLLGWLPNTKSSLDMGKLFEQFSFIPRKTKSQKAKIGKEELLAYSQRNPKLRPVLSHCLDITARRTIQSNFLDLALDYNDFYHPTYRLNGTKSGRFASEGADEGGPQAQNWPASLLNLVIPDNPETDELTEADLAAAEDRIIAWDSQDTLMMETFAKNLSSHSVRGCLIYFDWNPNKGLPPLDLMAQVEKVCQKCSLVGEKKCSHSRYHIAKTAGYAFKYKMGTAKAVQKVFPLAGVWMSETEAKIVRDKILTKPILNWHEQTDLELKKSRWLVNLLGRKREFYGLHDSSGELLREALSWKAQSVVGIVAGRAISRLNISLPKIDIRSRLLTQKHDSVLVSHPKSCRNLVYEAIDEAFSSPINAHGRILNIPTEKKSGPNWGELS